MSPKTESYEKTAREILKQLPDRTQEIIMRRYGLHGNDPETLEKIGQHFGITRERVRQIESGGLTTLREQAHDVVDGIFSHLDRHLDAHGGLRAEHHLADDFIDHASPEALQLFLDLGESFSRHRETDHRHTVWSKDRERVKEAEAFERAMVKRLKKINEELDEAAFWDLVESEARDRRLELTKKAQEAWVGISRNIVQGPMGNWGLKTWSGIAPRNVGDWAYIVLREAQEPMHFGDIVEGMNRLRSEELEAAEAISPRNRKPAHLQTVHNELIKDDRFVLVGRGIYALKEWGYEPGTVADVITRILKNANNAMPREDIVAKVSEVRRVQPNTILLNLQNKQMFTKDADGNYMLA